MQLVMGHINQFLSLLSIAFLWLFCDKAMGVESDVNCLISLFKSIQDPYGYLNTTWTFNNKTEGSICSFIGVECWHPNENKVLNIKLANMGLKGPFPRGLKNCSSLTGLDLSNNYFSGSIPSDISKIVTYVTVLDLSSNEFTGEVPADLSNCIYLNVLKLDHNQLSGPIPPQLSLFSRIKTFSVANNFLTGPIPNIAGDVADDYANNSGLCGKPLLSTCASLSKGSRAKFVVAAAVGGVIVSTVIISAVMIFLFRGASVRSKVQDPEGNNWTKSLKGSEGVQVSLFKKSVSKMKLGDLMKATNNFSKNNMIGSGRTGAMYTAVLQDGTLMMCKRLQDSQHSENEFIAEMTTIGGVSHQNLVPLLGFCTAKKERILLYKYMENGTLHDNLHPEEEDDAMKPLVWSQRLKIAIGAARAWLHHNCNPRILHRNISSKCILLDGEFEPKISDFGLARLMNPVDTHLSTFVNGEFGDLGYVAPEYARTLLATPKGDVYSFGIVLLELVTSERPTQVSRAPENFKGNLIEWITQLSDESKLEDAIDKFLMEKGVENEIFQVLKIACNCVLPSVAKERPTMFEVYQLLRAIGEPYNFYENEVMVPTDSGDAPWQELIVARDIIMD